MTWPAYVFKVNYNCIYRNNGNSLLLAKLTPQSWTTSSDTPLFYWQPAASPSTNRVFHAFIVMTTCWYFTELFIIHPSIHPSQHIITPCVVYVSVTIRGSSDGCNTPSDRDSLHLLRYPPLLRSQRSNKSIAQAFCSVCYRRRAKSKILLKQTKKYANRAQSQHDTKQEYTFCWPFLWSPTTPPNHTFEMKLKFFFFLSEAPAAATLLTYFQTQNRLKVWHPIVGYATLILNR